MKKTLKRLTAFLLSALCALSLLASNVSAIDFDVNFEVNSKSVYLYNMDSGMCVYRLNSTETKSPSFLAQIMTAIICLESIKDISAEKVVCNQDLYAVFDAFRSANPGGYVPTADFRPNEETTAEALLYGMMLQSSCECALSLANHVGGGSVAAFVERMNAKAKMLGAISTNFTNPHGLYDENQYTTAEDIALITQYAMSISKFSKIAGTYSYSVPATNKHTSPWTLLHSNIMMNSASENYYYSGVSGIKTANSPESGRCLVTTAKQNGNNYLLVLLDAPIKDAEGNDTFYHLMDAKNILDWAFKNISYDLILSSDEEICEIPVSYDNGDGYVIATAEKSFNTLWLSLLPKDSIDRVITKDENLVAPIAKGQVIGHLVLSYNGEQLYETNLIASSAISRSEPKYAYALIKFFPQSVWFDRAIQISALLVGCYTLIFILLRISQSQRQKKYDAEWERVRQQTRKRPAGQQGSSRSTNPTKKSTAKTQRKPASPPEAPPSPDDGSTPEDTGLNPDDIK